MLAAAWLLAAGSVHAIRRLGGGSWPNKRITKMGLVSFASMEKKHILAPFAPGSPELHNNDGAKWFYTYTVVPTQDQIDFANEYGVRFVPMLDTHQVNVRSMGPWRIRRRCDNSNWCTGYVIEPDLAKKNANGLHNTDLHLTQPEFQAILEKVFAKFKPELRPSWLMAHNEPEHPHMNKHNMTPRETAALYGKYVQTTARNLKLGEVSPTMNIHGWEKPDGIYFAKFLQECWNFRNDASYKCNIFRIGAISVHFYTCKASSWETNFNFPNGLVYRNMMDYLSRVIPSVNWKKYFRERKLWITEFNCNNDNIPGSWCQSTDWSCKADTYNNGATLASDEEACDRISGRASDSRPRFNFGQGVIRWLEDAPNVGKWSWWSTYNPGGNGPYVPSWRQRCASLVSEADPDDPSKPVVLSKKAKAILLGTANKNCKSNVCFAMCKEWGVSWAKKCTWSDTWGTCSGCPQCAR